MHLSRRYARKATRLGVAAALALAAPGLVGAQQRIDHRRRVAPDASIRMTFIVSAGSVRVVGWDRDSIAVTGTLGAGEEFGGGVVQNGSGAKFFVQEPGEGKVTRKATAPLVLEVRVPARARLWLKAGGADIDVSGLTGGLDVNIVSGRIRVAGALRELNAEAMDGDIDVTGSAGWLRAKTAGGAITLRGRSDDAGLSSVSGTLRVSGGPFTRARFETVTGDVRFEAAVSRDGALTFDTHSGVVELRTPRDLAADLEVSTIAGQITNELNSARPILGRDMRSRELGTSVGGGGARITIRTFKGSVALRRQ